jgi:drug/metabolite transporter (DMT)-like permease
MLALVISTLFEGMQWTPVMLFGVALILFGNVLILKKE